MNEWQPIETAPKAEGSAFLAWCPVWRAHVVLFVQDGHLWMPIGVEGHMAPRGAKPTHWMPLPDPPKDAGP